MTERLKAIGSHHKRQYDGRELPGNIGVRLVDSLHEVGGSINGLEEGRLSPNCVLDTLDGEQRLGVWYLNNPSVDRKKKIPCTYAGVNEFGQPKEYSFVPAGWVSIDGRWSPLTIRVLRVINLRDVNQDSEFLKRVIYTSGEKKCRAEELFSNNAAYALTSLGAAGNPFNIAYLLADAQGKILPSPAKDKWLVLDMSDVGYKNVCGAAERVYGPGCYFGGLWACANRSSAINVDQTVCKVKNPPWETQYFWAAIDNLVYNTDSGSSVKAGRMRFVNEDQSGSIPSWIHLN